MRNRHRLVVLALVVSALIASALAAVASAASARPFINRFTTITTLSSAVPSSGPAKGDENPYGVAVVPRTIGHLVRGDVLVSNFNNSQNQQGMGSSIVESRRAASRRCSQSCLPRPRPLPSV